MEKLTRWIARNRTLSLTCFAVLLGVVLGILTACIGLSKGAMVAMSFALAVPMVILVNYCSAGFLNKALKILHEQCDPYPFLGETREQLTYRNRPQMELVLKINHAMALRYAGEYQRSWEILHNIHIDKSAAISPSMKAVYYNNLTDILTCLGRYDEAEIWYRKTVQIINDLPKRSGAKLYNVRDGAIAEHFYRIGEYQTALERHRALERKNTISMVEGALFRAKCHIALAENEAAREDLEYVMKYGNKLHCVAEAREMLENCN